MIIGFAWDVLYFPLKELDSDLSENAANWFFIEEELDPSVLLDQNVRVPELLLDVVGWLLVALKLAEAGIKVSIIERTEIIRELQQKYGNIFSYQCKQQPN